MTHYDDKIRLAIADDHILIVKGITLLLSNSKHIDIIGHASDGKAALQLVKDREPDVLITDISMPNVSGIQLIEKIKALNLKTKVLVLSNFFNDQDILLAYEKGAKGYLPKTVDDQHLIFAIGKIAKGDTYYHQSVLDVLGTVFIQQRLASKKNEDLTQRELEVLKEVLNGATNKDIANKLFISVRTVDAHRRNIMKKLNVKNSVELVKVCIEKNLL